ncbi:MAG: peptide-methionine (R)-S-oxide reductase MsrB [Flavobacteriales bacterium]|nr:peptide-methionine (R)-S-oxide reductase MsrB [Flavobacteriales bacterium]
MSDTGYDETDLLGRLSPEEFRVLRRNGTEAPFTSPLNEERRQGSYHCKVCNTLLYKGSAKFDSGCGWPSFDAEADTDKVARIRDTSHGMIRVEIRCATCDSHLGHVFPDGPTETGMRHCVNGVCLDFRPEE